MAIKYPPYLKYLWYSSILYNNKFEQQFDLLKRMLQSLRLKYQTKIIGIDQYLKKKLLFLNIDDFRTSKSYTNMLGSVKTNSNSKIFLSLLWFLLLNYLPITVPDLP